MRVDVGVRLYLCRELWSSCWRQCSVIFAWPSITFRCFHHSMSDWYDLNTCGPSKQSRSSERLKMINGELKKKKFVFVVRRILVKIRACFFLLNHVVHFLDVSSLQMLRRGQDTLNVVGVSRGMKGVVKDLELSPFTVADR